MPDERFNHSNDVTFDRFISLALSIYPCIAVVIITNNIDADNNMNKNPRKPVAPLVIWTVGDLVGFRLTVGTLLGFAVGLNSHCSAGLSKTRPNSEMSFKSVFSWFCERPVSLSGKLPSFKGQNQEKP